MDRNTIIATVLIFVVIVLWPFYMSLFAPEEPVEKPATPGDRDTMLTVPPEKPVTLDAEKEPVKEPVRQDPPVLQTHSAEDSLPGAPAGMFHADTVESFVKIETVDFAATISNRGGGTLLRWELKKYKLKETGANVQLITREEKNFNLSFRANALDVKTKNLFFFPQGNVPDSIGIDRPLTLKYRLYVTPDRQDRYLEKTLTFYPDQYSFDVTVTFFGLGDMVTSHEYDFSWENGIRPTEKHSLDDDLTYFRSYGFIGDELEEVDIGTDLTGREEFTGKTHWTALRSKYFANFIIPKSRHAVACRLEGESEFVNNEQVRKLYNTTLMMEFEDNRTDSFLVYLGPLEYDILKTYNNNLAQIMDFGWAPFRPISKAILWIFKFLHAYIPNYGLVLIVFAFLVKIVLYPLTHKSFVSMQKMKDLAPKIEEVKTKYKDEPQKLQKETFALYKKEKINPLSGCIPLLFQMPILIPIYNVFYSTIELRGQGFVGWITDLSIPDTVTILHTGLPFIGDFPINPLPIIMTALTFIQQRLTPMTTGGGPTTSQGQQKMMMYLMPLVFFFIFNQFASGLVLYWTVYNVLTMIDQLLIAKRIIKT